MTNREKLSKMTIFGSDWTFFAQKRVKKEQNILFSDKFWSKKGQKYFCQNFHWVIIKIDHKLSLNKTQFKTSEIL